MRASLTVAASVAVVAFAGAGAAQAAPKHHHPHRHLPVCAQQLGTHGYPYRSRVAPARAVPVGQARRCLPLGMRAGFPYGRKP